MFLELLGVLVLVCLGASWTLFTKLKTCLDVIQTLQKTVDKQTSVLTSLEGRLTAQESQNSSSSSSSSSSSPSGEKSDVAPVPDNKEEVERLARRLQDAQQKITELETKLNQLDAPKESSFDHEAFSEDVKQSLSSFVSRLETTVELVASVKRETEDNEKKTKQNDLAVKAVLDAHVSRVDSLVSRISTIEASHIALNSWESRVSGIEFTMQKLAEETKQYNEKKAEEQEKEKDDDKVEENHRALQAEILSLQQGQQKITSDFLDQQQNISALETRLDQCEILLTRSSPATPYNELRAPGDSSAFESSDDEEKINDEEEEDFGGDQEGLQLREEPTKPRSRVPSLSLPTTELSPVSVSSSDINRLYDESLAELISPRGQDSSSSLLSDSANLTEEGALSAEVEADAETKAEDPQEVTGEREELSRIGSPKRNRRFSEWKPTFSSGSASVKQIVNSGGNRFLQASHRRSRAVGADVQIGHSDDNGSSSSSSSSGLSSSVSPVKIRGLGLPIKKPGMLGTVAVPTLQSYKVLPDLWKDPKGAAREQGSQNDLVSQLLIPIKVNLPFGGFVKLDVFQNATFQEIIDSLWGNLEVEQRDPDRPLDAKHFSEFLSMLLNPDMVIATALFNSSEPETRDQLVSNIVQIYELQDLFAFVKRAIVLELQHHMDTPNALFRGNTLSTIMIATCLKMKGAEYLRKTLSPVLLAMQQRFSANGGAPPEEDAKGTMAEILHFASLIFQAIAESVSKCPHSLRVICNLLYKTVEKSFPGFQLKIVAGFIFLRFFCPALVQAKSLFSDDPTFSWTPQMQRMSIKITRIIQSLVNQTLTNDSWASEELFQQFQKRFEPQVDTILVDFCRVNEPVEEVKSERGRDRRETITVDARVLANSIYKTISHRLKEVLQFVHSSGSATSREQTCQLTQIFGYPLEKDQRLYSLKFSTSEIYIPSGQYRPLYDNADITVYLHKNVGSYIEFNLVTRDQRRIEKGVLFQLSSLLAVKSLPSWNIKSDEINGYRKLITSTLSRGTTFCHPLPTEYFRTYSFETISNPPADMVQCFSQPARIMSSPLPEGFPSVFIVKVQLPPRLSQQSQSNTSSLSSSSSNVLGQSSGDVQADGADSLSQIVKAVSVTSSQTTHELMQYIKQKIKVNLPSNLDPSNFVFKIIGHESFITENVALSSVAFIRHSVLTRKPIHLAIVENTIPVYDHNVAIPKYSLEKEIENTLKAMEPLEYLSNDIGRSLEKHNQPVSMAEGVDPGERLSIHVLHLDNVNTSHVGTDLRGSMFYVQIELYHGNRQLCDPVRTAAAPMDDPMWNAHLHFKFRLVDLPKAARLCFTLFASDKKHGWKTPICWVATRLFDWRDCLNSGKVELTMWPEGIANPIGTCNPNFNSTNNLLHLHFPKFERLLQYTEIVVPSLPIDRPESPRLDDESKAKIDQLCQKDPLYNLSETDVALAWLGRDYIRQNHPNAIAKFLLSVNWVHREDTAEAYRQLSLWPDIPPFAALELLDAKFEDEVVRQFAVRQLGSLSDDQLTDFLLQIISSVKYERKHNSHLALFLLSRALCNRSHVGQLFFWTIKSELYQSEYAERLSLLLESYLRGCGTQRTFFTTQFEFVQKMGFLFDKIHSEDHNRRKNQILQQELRKIRLPPLFCPPVDSTFLAKGLVIDSCKVMDSAQGPLKLVLKNIDHVADGFRVLFKRGDDLRQDMLILQMFKVMDQLWKDEGMDLQLTPYRCVVTAKNTGVIEMISDSVTIADIQKRAGIVRGAFIEDTLLNYLREYNTTKPLLDSAIENFIHSVAGYCVATFVLGIGDRHNDNIMLSTTGHLFHIDFGHVLGNFQKWKGIKRDRAPFVFSPEYAFVMGGKNSSNFERFVKISCRAYAIVRRRANLFITLFALLLSTGITELKSEADIQYVRDAFALDVSEEEAMNKFKKLIYKALGTTATQINNALHILAHS